jgi:hypothetical protein
VTGSASITITAPVTTPPPNTGPADPSTYPIISSNPLSALDALGWRTSYNTEGLLSAVASLASLLGIPSALQFTYPIGFVGARAPATEFLDFQGVTHFYSGVSWMANANWQGNTSNVNKLQFVLTAGGTGGSYVCFYGPPGGPYELRVALEFVNADTRDFLVPNIAHVPVVLGQWHHIEWQMEYNTSTAPANGSVRWWLDGQLIGQYKDVLFPTAPISEYQISPTWGGFAELKTQTDYFWFASALLRGY